MNDNKEDRSIYIVAPTSTLVSDSYQRLLVCPQTRCCSVADGSGPFPIAMVSASFIFYIVILLY